MVVANASCLNLGGNMICIEIRRLVFFVSFVLVLICGAANALEVKGKGDVTYDAGLFSDKPDAETRQKAIKTAKESAWKRYTSTFSSAKVRLYSQYESDIIANLDSYVLDSTVIDESMDKNAHIFSVVIRMNINEAALDNKLNGAAMANAGGKEGSQASVFSFIFVARETESVKSFDAKRTDVKSEEKESHASQNSAVSGGGAAVGEKSNSMTVVTQGGSAVRKADETKYRILSASDIDAAMSETLASAGFDVTAYQDVIANCGGTTLDAIKAEFASADEMSPQNRKGAIDAARACGVTIFAVGTLDVGLPDIDPVTGNKRVYVSVRGQVWDITPKLPRKLASVGPVQFAGLSPESAAATRSALNLASKEGAKAIVDQLNAKSVR